MNYYSIIIDGIGGGGAGGGGGLDLHTLGCAYFKFFNNMVSPHNSHVPVGALFCINSSLFVITLISSSDYYFFRFWGRWIYINFNRWNR